MDNSLRSFATRDLVVVSWMENLDRAFGLMSANRVRHLPVIDDQGSIIGIISDRDLQRAMQIDQPDFTSGRVSSPEFDPNSRVRDFMSWPVEAIDEGRSFADAAQIMLTRKISSLVVTRGQRVVGIVTTEDLLRALIDRKEGAEHHVADDVQAALYNSPIGPIAHQLAQFGI